MEQAHIKMTGQAHNEHLGIDGTELTWKLAINYIELASWKPQEKV
jgi:hypothetical protein